MANDIIYSYDKQPKIQVNHPSKERVRYNSKNKEAPLLKPQSDPYIGKKTLVLDLDETLVHSSFKKVKNADIK